MQEQVLLHPYEFVYLVHPALMIGIGLAIPVAVVIIGVMVGLLARGN